MGLAVFLLVEYVVFEFIPTEDQSSATCHNVVALSAGYCRPDQLAATQCRLLQGHTACNRICHCIYRSGRIDLQRIHVNAAAVLCFRHKGDMVVQRVPCIHIEVCTAAAK